MFLNFGALSITIFEDKSWRLVTFLRKSLSTSMKKESKPFVVIGSSNIKFVSSQGSFTKGEGV